MCCFSRPVEQVFATKIFARAAEGARQFLVYSMSLKAKEDLAMVLPLPVRAGVVEKDVSFIDLKVYPDFFMDCEKGFPIRQPITIGPVGCAAPKAAMLAKLEVVQVGNFEASFVPTIADFARLDERFCLPAGTWEKLPTYRKFGFAVFKLKLGEQNVHPMAFSFPRADRTALFFPTVHIHDGEVHDKAGFDHVLYCQRELGDSLSVKSWRESPQLARNFVNVEKAKGLIAGDRHCYRMELRGTLANQDTVLGGRG